MPLPELPQYDETMTSLAAYLIVAPQKHPKALNTDTQDRISYTHLRMLNRYVLALRACGVPADTKELAAIADHLCLPFPRKDVDIIDRIELLRLEAFLHLRPDDPAATSRLRQLFNQRQSDFTYLVPTYQQLGFQSSVSDTLYAVHNLALAYEKRASDAAIDPYELTRTLDNILPVFRGRGKLARHDRDISLMLRLYHGLNGGLDKKHLEMLRLLVSKAQQSGGLWGVSSPHDAEDLIAAMYRRRLPSRNTSRMMDEDATRPSENSHDASRQNGHKAEGNSSSEHDLRNIIVTTCRVIENLAPLCQDYDFVASAVEQSMELWWGQFYGPHAPLTLHTIFPNETEYLTAACLTVTAANAYFGVSLKERSWIDGLRRHAEQYIEPSAEESVRIALQQWIDIDIVKAKPLELGMSGSSVLRIHPKISIPMLDDLRIPEMSLIVKYGPSAEIEKERQNYKHLPEHIKEHFVRIPNKSYTNDQGQTFVIMQDLNNYTTIFENYEWLLHNQPEQAARRLLRCLTAIHKGAGGEQRLSTNKHLLDIYIVPMVRESEQIVAAAEYVRRRGSSHDTQRMEGFLDINSKLQKLITSVSVLGAFPLAFMHGDLHTRNIMVKKARGPRKPSSYEYKLIDLEKMRQDGDAAHDAGQLLVDLDLLHLHRVPQRQVNVDMGLLKFRNFIEAGYIKFATERGDSGFRTRLDLAKTRAMIRIMKGRFKRAVDHLDHHEYELADDRISENIAMIDRMHGALDNVLVELVP